MFDTEWEINDIHSKFDYSDANGKKLNSKAFIHYFLKNSFISMTDDDVNECIVDGPNDNGIDAIVFEEEERIINFFQFKYVEPKPKEEYKKPFTQKETSPFLFGVKQFIAEKIDRNRCNDKLKYFYDYYNNLESEYRYKLWFVKLSDYDKIDINFESYLNSWIQELKSDYVVNIETNLIGYKEILNLYEKNEFNSWDSFKLHSKKEFSFKVGNIESFSLYVSISDLYESLVEKQKLFAGNVRYYLSTLRINKKIINTILDENLNKNFHLLNNGITIICDDISQDTKRNYIFKKGSVINGAQTVGSIISAIDKNKKSKNPINISECFVFLRIIKIPGNKKLREMMVTTLNTQNKMKLGYQISNDETAKLIQKKLINFGYFIELKNGEYYSKFLNNKSKKQDVNLVKIPIDNFFQILVSFYDIDSKAYMAKNQKASIVNDSIFDQIKNVNNFDIVKHILDMFVFMSNFIKNWELNFNNIDEKKNILSSNGIKYKLIDDFNYIKYSKFLILYGLGLVFKNGKKMSSNNIFKLLEIASSIFDKKQNLQVATRQAKTYDLFKEKIENNLVLFE